MPWGEWERTFPLSCAVPFALYTARCSAVLPLVRQKGWGGDIEGNSTRTPLQITDFGTRHTNYKSDLCLRHCEAQWHNVFHLF
eukprot:gene13906-biopygen18592